MSRPVDIFEKIVMSGANAEREDILRTPAAVDTDTRTFWGTDTDVTGDDPLRFDNSVTKGWDTPSSANNADATSAGQSGVLWVGSMIASRPFNIPFLRKPGENRDTYDDLFWSGLYRPLVIAYEHTDATKTRYLLSCKPRSSTGTANRWLPKNIYNLEAAWPWYVGLPITAGTAGAFGAAVTIPLQPPPVLYYIDVSGATVGATVQLRLTIDSRPYLFNVGAPEASFIICPAKSFQSNIHQIDGLEPPPFLLPRQQVSLSGGTGTTAVLRYFRNYNSPASI